MSLTITINNINNLTDTERAVLRMVADRATADSLKEAVRKVRYGSSSEASAHIYAAEEFTPIEPTIPTPPIVGQKHTPVEPTEVFSPHATVIDTPATVAVISEPSSSPDTLKQTVRGMAATVSDDLSEAFRKSDNARDYITGNGAPVEPTEVFSPHATVIDTPATVIAEDGVAVISEPSSSPDNRREVGEVVGTVAVLPPPVPASAELDSAGLPWDKRIHASTRAKVADGTWRYMRGVDKELVKQVEAELRAVQAIPVPEPLTVLTHLDGNLNNHNLDNLAATVLPPVPVLVNHDPAQSLPQGVVSVDGGGGKDMSVTINTASLPTPIVPLPPVPPAPPSNLPMTFTQLMQYVTPLLVSGKLNGPILQGIVENVGLPYLSALGARPDLVETVKAAIDEAVGGAV